MKKIVEEGSVKIKIADESKVSKKLPVFYNPVMKFNRDISILLLNCVDDKALQIALPLAGSGVRGLRFLKELKKGKIKTLYMNDYKDDFYDVMKENFVLNDLSNSDVMLSNEEANLFMLNNSGFDYIDIDPFGTPNPFLDSAMRRISREGILAVTATDTSALAGTYENACKRKYWALPLRNELQHEVGLRILIRKVQLVAAQYEKALTPLVSYSKDHYMRVFFRCEKAKSKVDVILKNHGYFKDAGPMWLGSLQDKFLLKKMIKAGDDSQAFLRLLMDEEHVGVVGFYDIHILCKKNKLKIPRFEALSDKLKSEGYKFSRTHFSRTGFRINIEEKMLVEIIRQLS